MKNISFLFLSLFVFAAQLATAQTKEVLTDTTYNVNRNGTFLSVNFIGYSDGSYTETATPQTDTNAVFNQYVQNIETRANAIASAAVVAMQARAFSVDAAKLDTQCVALTGRSPVSLLMKPYGAEFLTGSWVIVVNGVTTNVVFSELSTTGRLRLTPAGGTAKTMLLFGNFLRMTNYPATGINLLYRVKSGLWSSQDKTVVLKKA